MSSQPYGALFAAHGLGASHRLLLAAVPPRSRVLESRVPELGRWRERAAQRRPELFALQVVLTLASRG